MNIYNITFEELEEYFIKNNDKKFKATQVFDWVYKKRINNFDEMRNVSKSTIDCMKKDFYFEKLEIIEKLEDKDVKKYLFRLNDNEKIEAVVMYHDYGLSLCISTQVGCNMGCKFCESGRLKKVRNLEVYEMVTQILMIEEDINQRISHIVLMGIGEPFDNYDNVIKFIDIINCGKGIDIGSRHITVSTCGIVPKIKEFTNYDKQVNLAISLHAPNNTLRSTIMNINKVYPIEDIISSIKKYIEKTGRRVTFEYIMLKDVNDSKSCALELSKLLKGINCYVNLIPYNETTHIEYKKSTQDSIMQFYDVLKKNNIGVTIRREFGSNVKAACGQLRSHYEEVV
ncbi:MAG: 23S rRNA (adenine(2503)-C(2))-methyltransferase RlmN [bacterium]|nr:23S rRNA (adenine(2503)-C(2))-methyltransferase RlmN [bacterium]